MQATLARHAGFFERAFPAPRYLAMPAVGIDISDFSIKFLSFERDGSNTLLGPYGKVDLPIGSVEHGEIRDPETLVKLLTKIRRDHNFTFVHLSLPEEHAYLFQTELPNAPDEELAQMIEFHLKENVPMGAEEALFDYAIYETKGEMCKVNVSVYPSSIVERYLEVFDRARLPLLSVEIEAQATARALLAADETSSAIIVDVGRSEASLSIVSDGFVSFTASLEIGGDQFTRAISRSLDISFQEAEKLKRDQGFADTRENGAVYDALVPKVRELRGAIEKHYRYWQMHTESGQAGSVDVERVILVGGNACIRGLPEYLEASLETPIEIGNVWRNVFSIDETIPSMHHSESLEFATAIGLALRSTYRGA